MANRFFGGKDPIGQHVDHVLGNLQTLEPVEIVGIVTDTRPAGNSAREDRNFKS
jgi:hypothetical protein